MTQRAIYQGGGEIGVCTRGKKERTDKKGERIRRKGGERKRKGKNNMNEEQERWRKEARVEKGKRM